MVCNISYLSLIWLSRYVWFVFWNTEEKTQTVLLIYIWCKTSDSWAWSWRGSVLSFWNSDLINFSISAFCRRRMQRLGDGIALLWSPGRAGGNNVAPSSLLLSWFYRGNCLLLQAPPVHHFFQAAVPTTQSFLHFPGWVCPADFPQGLSECRDRESLTQLHCVTPVYNDSWSPGVTWGTCRAEEIVVLWP